MGDASFDSAEYHDASSIQQQQSDLLFTELEKTCEKQGMEPDRILDVGCGTGRVTRELASQYPEAEILAIDASEKQISVARETTTNPRITYQHVDVLDVSLDTPVDVVFSNAALHWVQDQPVLYSHLKDIVRPGGIIAVHQGHHDCYIELRRSAYQAADAVCGGGLFDGFEYPLAYHTKSSIRELLGPTQFRIRQMFVVESDVPETLIDDFVEAGLLPFREQVAEGREEEFVDEFKQKAESHDTINSSRLYFVAQKIS